jgi:hypothetical protein
MFADSAPVLADLLLDLIWRIDEVGRVPLLLKP